MQLVHADAMAWSEREEKHREGHLAFKTLFKGEEGDPNNFRWVLSRSNGDYHSPHHRHNFDQVRFSLEGSANIAPGKSLNQGDAGYFPEGTFYGPQNDEAVQRMTLVLQCGGASGLGYMSSAQLRRGQEELAKVGAFGGGRYRRDGEPDSASRDSYEAIWEHVFAREIAYPPQRYDDPVMIRTAAFAWKPIAGDPGASRKPLGSFTERGTRLDMLRIADRASAHLGEAGAMVLAFVVHGSGSGTAGAWRKHSAFCLASGETVELVAGEAAEIFVIALPVLPKPG